VQTEEVRGMEQAMHALCWLDAPTVYPRLGACGRGRVHVQDPSLRADLALLRFQGCSQHQFVPACLFARRHPTTHYQGVRGGHGRGRRSISSALRLVPTHRRNSGTTSAFIPGLRKACKLAMGPAPSPTAFDVMDIKLPAKY